MVLEIIGVKQIVRRMRGGSQAFLVEGDDDQFYVAKFIGNPQGDHTLINEWIVHRIFDQLGISTPPLRILHLTKKTQKRELLYFHLGARVKPIEGLFHLGSRCPVNPTRTAIYDFLPRRLLSLVVNLKDVGSAFVLDTWFAQIDSRQAIFVRETDIRSRLKLRLYLIDHGMSFGGHEWKLRDAETYGLYMDRTVYSILDMESVCEDVLLRIDTLSEVDLYAAAKDLPACWFGVGDRAALTTLFALLEKRRNRLRFTISRSLEVLHSKTAQPLRGERS